MSLGDTYLTLIDAAKELNLTKQAIWLAVKNKRVVYKLVDRKIMVLRSSLLHYIKNKHKRIETTTINGEKIFSIEKGLVPIPFMARLLKIESTYFYTAMKFGYISPIKRVAHSYVFKSDDLLAYAVLKKFITEEQADVVRKMFIVDQAKLVG